MKTRLVVIIFIILLAVPGKGVCEVDTPTDGTNRFVGAEKCSTCHKEEYDGWLSTFHPYKFQDAVPGKVVGDFTLDDTLVVDGKPVFMSMKGDEYFMTTEGPDGRRHTYRVDYVIGIFWKQLYVTKFPDGELRILPAMWIVQTGKWVGNNHWNRTLYQYACTGCHNTGTRLNFDESSGNFDTDWTDKGVSCEACHGKGLKHVESMEKGGDSRGTIVNPAKIPDPRLAAMVCGACHNRGVSKDGHFGYPEGFEPGADLDRFFIPKPKLHPDGSSKANRQQYVDWLKSGHAEEGVVCWDCHFTHRKGISNKYQTKLPGNNLCRSCHDVEHSGVHGIHSVNDCIGCHMPAVGKRAVQGDVHSHTFEVISPGASIEAGGVDKQPNSCNSCHYHSNDNPKKLQKALEKARAGRN